MESRDNTLDGCTACGCRVQGHLEPGEEGSWWIAFGLVTLDAQGDWAASDSSSRCGRGSFEQVRPSFERTIGTPYVILDFETTASVSAAGESDLETRSSLQKLSDLDPDGKPAYVSSARTRQLRFSEEATISLPLLLADSREKEAFGVHEVLLQLRATILKREPAASYGRISLSADVPGAEVLLEGGLVGRVVEGRPMLLKNVRVGTRAIRIRDFSGREVRRQVIVGPNKTAEVALEILDLSTEQSKDLVPLGENPQGYEEYWRVKDGALVVRIPAGEFLMGSPEGEGEAHERPQRRVYVSEFLIDKTEVTWRQFRKFNQATGAPLPEEPVWGTRDDYPAAFVLWQAAKDYCEWVGGRLPTEAEWEKAARGEDGRIYPWGDEWDPERCNSLVGGPHRPEAVGSFPGCVSPYGLLDLPGSISEWCADWYEETYYTESPSRDPKGPTSGSLRVVRGAAWMGQHSWLRAAYRFKSVPSSPHANRGFRCAQEVPE
jgi:formylglycine-generating enzyme required for sulfatase activity